MNSPQASPAVWVNGTLNVDIKGIIGGKEVSLGSWTTTRISISFSPFGGYRLTFGDSQGSASERIFSIALRPMNEALITGYYEHVVTERGIQPYDFEVTSSSRIAVSELASNLYHYSFDNLQLCAKASHGDETRTLTGSGFFLLQELTYPL